MPLPYIAFHTEDLFSPSGFDDGSLLDAAVATARALQGIDPAVVSSHDALVETVERFVLPKLDQHVRCSRWMTGHNPIRVRSVEGESADSRNLPTLTPKVVHVDLSDIEDVVLAIASRGPLPPPTIDHKGLSQFLFKQVDVTAGVNGVAVVYTGMLLAVHSDFLVLCDDQGSEMWVDRAKVLSVSQDNCGVAPTSHPESNLPIAPRNPHTPDTSEGG